MSGQSFEIEGGHPISGTIRPSGNKNAALPLIAACLLTEDEVVLHNVPQIRDVAALLELLAGLGVTVSPRGASSVRLARLGRQRRRGRPQAGQADPGLHPAGRAAARAPRPRAPAAAGR
jgi:UDP-N-acetylglucosamine enolpyruvyl transferase